MAKLKKKELEQIVARDLPGYKVSPQSKAERADEDASDARNFLNSADAEPKRETSRESTLSRKYLGGDASDDEEENDNDVAAASDVAVAANPGHKKDASTDDDDEEIVAVEPETASHPWDRGARAKAVVIKNKKIIGMQG